MKKVKASIGSQKYKTEIQAKNHIITADEPVEVGGQNLGFTPTELLESSLATCTAMTLRMYADRKEWELKEAKVNVSFKRNIKTHEIKFRKEIELFGNLTDEQREKLLEMGKKCPIEKILKGDITVDSKLL
ncbi:OsmC family protein [Oceanihabitans sediminis]|uniref:OsmC family peroxiredoxin n=1 Tax=Oceanihabitans sediminis TaxID=1812012 RepID=A0A368P5B8_9FLAO|nr:OsmC family protein [Oceanihabitans sediminis]MDX1278340.1 OsmC family protein [Oceanihabitans sediminis]MDX1773345.1 OsmC family protein [Oceanihabitans sediminis]RBP32777.1 putative redox protein [Oceanihabitans sediminis]RCU57688.1 OsmC family peroxiredoxin [Oceanihabitans sediminis]